MEATGSSLRRHYGDNRMSAVLLNLLFPFTTAQGLALKGTMLLLQTLLFLAVSNGLVLAASTAALYTTQKRRPVGA